jgi:hypothetical protein
MTYIILLKEHPIQCKDLPVHRARIVIPSECPRAASKKEIHAQEQSQPFSRRLHQKPSRFVHALGVVRSVTGRIAGSNGGFSQKAKAKPKKFL